MGQAAQQQNQDTITQIRPWSAIPDDLIVSDLSDAAFRVYALLRSYDGGKGAWPSRATLAHRLKRSVRAIARALAELQAAGVFIDVEHQAGKPTKYQTGGHRRPPTHALHRARRPRARAGTDPAPVPKMAHPPMPNSAPKPEERITPKRVILSNATASNQSAATPPPAPDGPGVDATQDPTPTAGPSLRDCELRLANAFTSRILHEHGDVIRDAITTHGWDVVRDVCQRFRSPHELAPSVEAQAIIRARMVDELQQLGWFQRIRQAQGRHA